MKCKQEREKTKDARNLRRELLKALKKMNPKRDFRQDGNVIYVNTYELWKLTIPKDWEKDVGKNKAEVKQWDNMMVIKRGPCIIYIQGQGQ